MTSYLMPTIYPPDCEMNMSDQITVPADLWTALEEEHGLPLFVTLSSGAVGRLRPAVPSEELAGDSCRLPEWMYLRSGYDADSWAELTVCSLPTADTIVLRARQEATLTGSSDPVAMLTAALSGSDGLSWACLSAGSELPLTCGVFDVIEIRTADGPVPAACILDCDVNLEIVRALDRPPTPVPEPIPETVPEPTPKPTHTGFVPFSGQGRRLGGPT
jgi:hypothetical protein